MQSSRERHINSSIANILVAIGTIVLNNCEFMFKLIKFKAVLSYKLCINAHICAVCIYNR